jgi:hypothetical protein
VMRAPGKAPQVQIGRHEPYVVGRSADCERRKTR